MQRKWICYLALVTSFCGSGVVSAGDEEALKTARKFRKAHAEIDPLPEKPLDFAKTRSLLAEKKDPQTKFGYLVFSVSRHREKLLRPEQAAQLQRLIQARSEREIDWHDVRNIVRVRAQVAMWEYAESVDRDDQFRKKKIWQQWTDQRLAYMLEEMVADYQFQQAAWEILDQEQQQKLLSGVWDKYMKKSTGHKRLFGADKQIRKALGPPDDTANFEKAKALWSEKWPAMWERYQAAATFDHKRQFYRNLSSEAFAIHAWQENYAPAFREFADYECEAVRDLLQSGYSLNDSQLATLAAYRKSLRDSAAKKFEGNPEEILQLLRRND